MIFLIDITLTAISFVASYLICTSIWPGLVGQKVLIQLPVIIAITSLIFLFIGHSKGVVKYDRTKEVYSIFNAICLANILTILLVVVHNKIVTNDENSFLIPLSIIVVHSLLSFIALMASRFLFKAFHSSVADKNIPLPRILIIGKSENSQKLIEAFVKSRDDIGEYVTVGFVSLDENVTTKTSADSIWIIGKDELNVKLLKDHKISEFIVPRFENLDKKLSEFLVKISTFPLKIKLADLSNDGRNENELRITGISDLKIADLYTPDSVAENSRKDHAAYLKDKKILVIGAAGCVGSALIKNLAKYKCKSILLLDKSDDSLFKLEQELAAQKIVVTKTLMADILDKNRLENVFKEFSPDIVVNAAGYKIFDFTKNNLYEAVRLNILGNKLLADMSVRYDVEKFINLSRSFPIKYCSYSRATERIGEMYLNCLNDELKTNFINIRFGNVLESKSSVMNVFMRQLRNGGPIKISSKDAFISFISVDELTNLIIEAIFLGKGGEIFKVKMGNPIKEIDLARRMVAQSHVEGRIDIVVAENLNIDEPMCKLNSVKSTRVQHNINEKLDCIIEDEFATKSIIERINELCVANLFFDKNITILMDQILQYETTKSSQQKSKNDASLEAKNLEEKINPLAV
ncbi:MAG: polysaccharide biosynthesis protein [Maribacter sp.]